MIEEYLSDLQAARFVARKRPSRFGGQQPEPEGWREPDHDDPVLALALAVYVAGLPGH